MQSGATCAIAMEPQDADMTSASRPPSEPPSTGNQDLTLETDTSVISSAIAQSSYQYDPLKADRIRLFRILPREKDRLLRLEINHHAFAQGKGNLSDTTPREPQTLSAPKYFALSYTWGSKTPNKRIQLNGQSFHIRVNLWSFLRRLESPCWPSHYLWADAICINQADNAEKSVQVSKMNEIFGRADGVLAWVGEEADDSHLLMNVAKVLREQETRLALPSLYAAAERMRVWRALKAFLERPYWKRTWVMQEIVLAIAPIHVHCGIDVTEYAAIYGLFEGFKLSMEHKDLKAPNCKCRKRQDVACKHMLLSECAKATCRLELPILRSYHQSGHEMERMIDPTLNHFYQQHTPRERLLDVLHRYRYTECEDPRDKIFALLQIQSDIPKALIPHLTNYNKDVHFLFFEILSFHTRPNEFLEREPEERFFRYRELSESLVECARFLMWNLRISILSTYNWVRSTHDFREQLRVNEYLKPDVVLENACGYGGTACISSVSLIRTQDPLYFYEFDIVDNWFAERPHMRGVAVDSQVGDWVYRAEGSDIAVVFKRDGQHSLPVSWAIIGEGSDWKPQEQTLQRLEVAKHEPIPSFGDIRGINEREEGDQILDMMRQHMAETGISTEDLPSSRNHTIDRTDRPPERYMLSLDLPVALLVMLGHFQTKSEIEMANRDRTDDSQIRSTLGMDRERVAPIRCPRIRLKSPWRRHRSRGRRPARMYNKVFERSRRHRLNFLWRTYLGPLVNMSYRDQRVQEFRQWQDFLKSIVDEVSTPTVQQMV